MDVWLVAVFCFLVVGLGSNERAKLKFIYVRGDINIIVIHIG